MTTPSLQKVPNEQAPMALLLEADPSPVTIARYLQEGHCVVARLDDAIVGVYVIKALTASTWELMNIAVAPEHQGQGIGALLLHHAIDQARQLGAKRLELGTGSFGHQLTFYQRAGFRVVAVEPDYFLTHYPEPLFENGLQHRDRLRLALEL
ncbi:GCN5 family acetyltransferase [Ectopseudomonas composti]|jgi:GNAT superfamily N-acetyltransferase|uniref:GCN5 family acetyltransferase n=1 Tax=Ectopseudomonas composti TaxID=658457 RepID=A0ABN0SAT7_9GAMM|nr:MULTISPECIES: GNAT family N-acetyltransferase [Pseudomonas]EZH79602.1 GCN5 family acetyltransferase [Pseudomonas composti]MBG0847672.1 GNAT family N-acetyltransferase [Pseudomonas chengduensis]